MNLPVPVLILGVGFLLATAGTAHADDPVSIDVVDGTLSIVGDDTRQTLALRLLAGDDTHLVVDIGDDGTADAILARAGIDAIVIETAGAKDTITIDDSEGVFTDTQITTIDGGRNDDVVSGGGGGETIRGNLGDDVINPGDGDDVVVGGSGHDFTFLGDGNDEYRWRPGDDFDIVEGQFGDDTLTITGDDVADAFTLSRNGARVDAFHDGVLSITAGDFEDIDIAPVGGADDVTVNDLDGATPTAVAVDLGDDGARDDVVVQTTTAADTVTVAGTGGLVAISGLDPAIDLSGAEPDDDKLRLELRGGDDIVDAGTLDPSSVHLTLEGGADDDVLIGSFGDDTLRGGTEDDVLLGGFGTDILDGGSGSNTLIQD